MRSRSMIIEPVGSREQIAGRLLKAAKKHSIDPDTGVDWDAPAVPGLLYLRAERCSLYGTDVWSGLSQEQKIELSKHELASGFSVGIWTETMLMQMLLRHVYDEGGTSNHAWNVFTEVAEECRHSMMFGKFMAVTGSPQYGHWRLVHELARIFKTFNSTALTFAGALFVEEVGDQLQREIMVDETVQPLARAVTNIHVVEEASSTVRQRRTGSNRSRNVANGKTLHRGTHRNHGLHRDEELHSSVCVQVRRPRPTHHSRHRAQQSILQVDLSCVGMQGDRVLRRPRIDHRIEPPDAPQGRLALVIHRIYLPRYMEAQNV